MAVDDSYTKVLLHMDGTDASTTFTDESGKSWTRSGDAQIDTAQSVFGGAAGLFDTNDYIYTADHADFNIAALDFSFDFRLRLITTGFQIICGQYGGAGNNGWVIYKAADNNFVFQYTTDGSSDKAKIFAWTPSTATWYHVAITRNGANLRAFIDGTQIGSTINVGTDSIFNSTSNFVIGDSTNGTNGWIDEFRYSLGIARWTANFTPPPLPYGIGGQVIMFS
jgi:hypothetical protein